jgi:hypothetical protein
MRKKRSEHMPGGLVLPDGREQITAERQSIPLYRADPSDHSRMLVLTVVLPTPENKVEIMLDNISRILIELLQETVTDRVRLMQREQGRVNQALATLQEKGGPGVKVP